MGLAPAGGGVCSRRLLAPIVKATTRAKRPLRGKDKIAMRVGKVIGKYKMAKHFHLDITDTSFSYRRNAEAIEAEAALDGLYIVRTSLTADELDAEAAVQAYKGLSVVERAFRSYKTVDLKVRPIYHFSAERVRAHVFLCMLAYYVEWHLRQRLAPLLFDDHEPAAAERASVVAPAQPSPARVGQSEMVQQVPQRLLGDGDAQVFRRRQAEGDHQAHRGRPARAQLAHAAR